VFAQLENALTFKYILTLKVKKQNDTPKEHLEDEIWSLIRMSPEKLPWRIQDAALFFLSALASKHGIPKCDSVKRKATK
jgi:hypothetical protein